MLEWITGQGRSSGFFSYLHLMEPHDRHRRPMQQLRNSIEALDTGQREFVDLHAMPSACRKPDSAPCLRSKVYTASVLETREFLAGLLQTFESSGWLDNTVVILFSDHGEAFREHRREHRNMQEDPRNMYGTGHGQYLYQELLNVPLLAWIPGQPGAEHTTRVSLVDIFPSVMHWLGLEPAGNDLPGRALASGHSGAPDDRVVYASNIAYGTETIAILEGDRKAVYWPADDRFMFFNLSDDPFEKKPLANDQLELEFSTLAGDYLDMRRDYDSTGPVPAREQLQELQSIGYLQGVDAAESEPDATRGGEGEGTTEPEKDTPKP